VSASRYEEVAAHDLVSQELGMPIRLHIDPRETAEWAGSRHRNRSLAQGQVRQLYRGARQYGDFDWHEYPYASTLGGLGAIFSLVDRSQNKSHGRDLSQFFTENKLRLGDCFDVIVVP